MPALTFGTVVGPNKICSPSPGIQKSNSLYTLLEHHSVDEMVKAYLEKYPSSNRMIGLRSLTYFDDIDFDREPALMTAPIDFAAVRERLRQAVLEPFRTFP